MKDIQRLFDNNREWATQQERDDPGFFSRHAKKQAPDFLWIGCSDSRVPASRVAGLLPGEVFVHRNVANVVYENDLNCMSALDFAIRQLKVRHVVVCGHYGCGGVRAAIEGNTSGALDHWLSGIRELWSKHRQDCEGLDLEASSARLAELNVLHQVETLCGSTVIREAWSAGQEVNIHGWIYGIEDGLLRSLGEPISAEAQ